MVKSKPEHDTNLDDRLRLYRERDDNVLIPPKVLELAERLNEALAHAATRNGRRDDDFRK